MHAARVHRVFVYGSRSSSLRLAARFYSDGEPSITAKPSLPSWDDLIIENKPQGSSDDAFIPDVNTLEEGSSSTSSLAARMRLRRVAQLKAVSSSNPAGQRPAPRPVTTQVAARDWTAPLSPPTLPSNVSPSRSAGSAAPYRRVESDPSSASPRESLPYSRSQAPATGLSPPPARRRNTFNMTPAVAAALEAASATQVRRGAPVYNRTQPREQKTIPKRSDSRTPQRDRGVQAYSRTQKSEKDGVRPAPSSRPTRDPRAGRPLSTSEDVAKARSKLTPVTQASPTTVEGEVESHQARGVVVRVAPEPEVDISKTGVILRPLSRGGVHGVFKGELMLDIDSAYTTPSQVFTSREVIIPPEPKKPSSKKARLRVARAAKMKYEDYMEIAGGSYKRYMPGVLTEQFNANPLLNPTAYAGLALARRADVGPARKVRGLRIIKDAIERGPIVAAAA